jgi:hypothetical protein
MPSYKTGEQRDIYVKISATEVYLTTRAALILLQSLIVAADLIVFDTGNAFLSHGLVMSYPIFGETAFFLHKDIQHHSHH